MRSPLASPFRGGWRNLTPMRGRGRGGANPWTPAMLPPYAWYDAELGQPRNVGYVELDGASGDNIQTPDSAALSFSNDIEVVMRVRVTDWSTGSGQTLCGKYVSTGDQRSWRFYVSSTGAIGLTASANGTAVTSVTVTPTVAMTDAAWVWLRLRLDLNNGANSVGTVETAADTGDNVEPLSWTANGTNTGTTIAGLFDSTAPLEIGSFENGASERLVGSVGRCIVRSGFGGAVVADFNADDCYGDGYTHTDGYRWTLGLPKIYDRSGNNHPPAVFGAGSNQPLWLPWLGASLVYLPGVIGNYVSCPDAAPLDITGDIEIVARVALDDWSPAAAMQLVARYDASSNRSYSFNIDSSGRLYLSTTTDGTSGTTVTASATSLLSGTPDRTALWLKVTLDVDDGASGKVHSFFYAPDQASEPTSWTSLGSTTSAGTTSIFAGSRPLELGARASGALDLLAGRIHRVIVRNGIGGTTVADFDAALCGQGGYTDAQGNPWAVNRSSSGRKSVVQSPAARSARSRISRGSDDLLTMPTTAMPPMSNSDPWTAGAVIMPHATVPSGARILDDKASTSNSALGLSFRYSGSNVLAVLGDGTNSAITAGAAPTNGVPNVVGVVASTSEVYVRANSVQTAATARPANSQDSSATPYLGAIVGPTAFIDDEFIAEFSTDSEMSAIEWGLMLSYYGGGL